jgi:branched-chain amino acid transport system ATP-binding protein
MLLDEFMAGISASEVPHAVDLVKSINARGVTVVLVEHIVKAITEACDRVIVLDAGRKLAEGLVQEIVHDQAVIQAYLGSRHAGG